MSARAGDASQVACDHFPTRCNSMRARHVYMHASAMHRKLHAINFRCVARPGVTCDHFPMRCESRRVMSACAHRRHIASYTGNEFPFSANPGLTFMSACASVMRRKLHVISFRCLGSTDGTVMSACARQCIVNCVAINLHGIVINFGRCMLRRDHRKLHKISFRCCTSRREPHECMRASATHRKLHAMKF